MFVSFKSKTLANFVFSIKGFMYNPQILVFTTYSKENDKY